MPVVLVAFLAPFAGVLGVVVPAIHALWWLRVRLAATVGELEDHVSSLEGGDGIVGKLVLFDLLALLDGLARIDNVLVVSPWILLLFLLLFFFLIWFIEFIKDISISIAVVVTLRPFLSPGRGVSGVGETARHLWWWVLISRLSFVLVGLLKDNSIAAFQDAYHHGTRD